MWFREFQELKPLLLLVGFCASFQIDVVKFNLYMNCKYFIVAETVHSFMVPVH